jgi:hypothetical protein
MANVDLVERTSAGLRNALFDELDNLKSGSSDPKRANAVARISSEIVRTVLMEVQVAQHMRAVPAKAEVSEGALPEPLKLGKKRATLAAA